MKFKRILYVFFANYPQEPRLDKQIDLFTSNNSHVRFLLRSVNPTGYRYPAEVEFFAINEYYRNIFTFSLDFNIIWKKFIDFHIREFTPDLIIVREMFLAKLTANIAAKMKIPVIMDMAENYPAAMKEWKKYNSNFIKRFIVHTLDYPSKIEQTAVKMMDGIIVVCDEQIDRLNTLYGFPTENMISIHNVPYSNFGKCDHKNPNLMPTFIHHGNMTAEKSLSEFILACEIVKSSGHKFEVILPGFGDCEGDYKNLVNKLNLNDNVKFLGRFNNIDLYKFLEKAHFGVIPYQLNEFNNYTVHNKLFEYFAFGLPVIATPMKPTKRILEQTGAGIVTYSDKAKDIAEAMIRFLSEDTSHFKESSKKANQVFNWDVESYKLLTFINKTKLRIK